jgi:hypothetical protein
VAEFVDCSEMCLPLLFWLEGQLIVGLFTTSVSNTEVTAGTTSPLSAPPFVCILPLLCLGLRFVFAAGDGGFVVSASFGLFSFSPFTFSVSLFPVILAVSFPSTSTLALSSSLTMAKSDAFEMSLFLLRRLFASRDLGSDSSDLRSRVMGFVTSSSVNGVSRITGHSLALTKNFGLSTSLIPPITETICSLFHFWNSLV